jgi:DNA-binding IclR family transcriptional regulator
VKNSAAVKQAGVGGGTVPALQRGLEILEAVSQRPQGATFSELKTALAIPSASLARLLQVLHAQRFLTRGADATWQLGPSLVRLGSIAADRNDLFSVARPSCLTAFGSWN